MVEYLLVLVVEFEKELQTQLIEQMELELAPVEAERIVEVAVAAVAVVVGIAAGLLVQT